MLPFIEELLEDNNEYTLVKRSFSRQLASQELVWHRDKEDRSILVKEGRGWYIQLDNELPQIMQKESIFKIPKETWHRIINKNGTNLTIVIKKHKYL